MSKAVSAYSLSKHLQPFARRYSKVIVSEEVLIDESKVNYNP